MNLKYIQSIIIKKVKNMFFNFLFNLLLIFQFLQKIVKKKVI